MNDIDFDELDKAVNSLANNSPVDDGATNVSDASTQSNDVKDTTAPKRTNGQFFDMVKTPSRSNVVVPTRPTQPVSTSPTLSQSNMNMQNVAEDLPSKPADNMSSPFLPDAKVEKRPLGAFSEDLPKPSEPIMPPATVPEPEPPMVDNASAPIATDAELKSNDETDMMPEELSKDVLDVESKSSLSDSYAPSPVVGEKPAENSIVTPASTVNPIDNNQTASINQQYQEKTPANETKTEAMYNTETYPNGLAKPVKKKSGMWTVVWILALLIVGAGAGAAVYFFVLPN